MNRGSCLCADITWQIDGEPTLMSNCHCSMCRKAHGMAFATYVVVSADAFRWTGGESRIQKYESSPGARRPFCPRCGSRVPTPSAQAGSVFMPAGNMDGELSRPLDNHIFVGSKAPWYEITDAAPQFEEFPPGSDVPAQDRAICAPKTEGAIGGSCLCGAVVFEFDEPLDRMGYCHCSRCRKSRSAAHSAQTFAARDKFRWLRGRDRVRSFKLPESQFFIASFCDGCGAPMPTLHEGPGIAILPAGALDQDPGIRPQAHIFVGSKAPWFHITDALPQFDASPGE